jgi:hypothetical protein
VLHDPVARTDAQLGGPLELGTTKAGPPSDPGLGLALWGNELELIRYFETPENDANRWGCDTCFR